MILKQLPYTLKTHTHLTEEELLNLPVKDEVVMDTESYPNYWLFAIKHLPTGKVFTLESSPDVELQETLLLWVMYHFTIISFNGNNYDIPMIWAAYKNSDPEILNQLSNDIITSECLYKTNSDKSVDHIDIIEVLPPPTASQKLYAGRLHSKRMQSLPYSPHRRLTKSEADYLKDYCLNDLDDLELCYNEIRPQIELRKSMSKQYGIDLRSKSDAQIAEAVIVKECAKELGYTPRRPRFNPNLVLHYAAPSYLHQNAALTRPALELVESLDFTLNKDGSPATPDKLKDFEVRIGNTNYRMGIGGLHSCESSCYYTATDKGMLIDADAVSFYPSIILNNKFYPKHLSDKFLKVYDTIVKKRIESKKKAKIIKDTIKELKSKLTELS